MKRDNTPEFVDAGCSGKQRFDTYTQASQAAKRSRHNGHGKRTDEVYHCRYCRGFHIGSSKSKGYGKKPRRDDHDDRTGFD